tara:strand:- start:2302 stop:2571 length:270 start_codon:yes stop_codon:yes gene_type:complete
MPDNISDANALSNLISDLYTEVFQRNPANPNSPITRTQHTRHFVALRDDLKTRLLTASSITYVWGLSGFSDEVQASPQSVRWGFTGEWA